VYDLFGEMLAALNTFSLIFCVFLNVKVSSFGWPLCRLCCSVLFGTSDGQQHLKRHAASAITFLHLHVAA